MKHDSDSIIEYLKSSPSGSVFTLSDDEINPAMERIIEALKTAHQTELRY